MSNNPPVAPDEVNAAQGSPQSTVDTGLACLVIMAQLHGVPADADQLSHQYKDRNHTFGQTEILLAAKQLELKAKAVKISFDRLEKTPLPAVARGKDGLFFILARFDKGQVLIQSPIVGRPESLSIEELQARWDGDLILFTSRASLAGDMAKFDFTWFIPAVVKYRKLLSKVL